MAVTVKSTRSQWEESSQVVSLVARRERLVRDHSDLVKRVARSVLRKLPASQTMFEEDDLYQIGIMGLFEAERNYRHDSTQSFATYAEFRIRGAMLDELRRRDFFPRRLRLKANKLRRTEERLAVELGRAATEDELAEAMEITPGALRKLRDQTTPYRFLDYQDPNLALETGSPLPSDIVLERERRQQVLDGLRRLPEREAMVLDLYYNKGLKLREIAELMSYTESRISQIKTAAIRMLRQMLLD